MSKDYANENNFKILKEESNESSQGCLNGTDQNGHLILRKITNKDLIYPSKEVKINLTETKRSKKGSIISVHKSHNDMSGCKTIRRDSSKGRLQHLKIRTTKRMSTMMRDLVAFGAKEPLTGVPNAESPLIKETNAAIESRLHYSKCNTEKKLAEEEKPHIDDFEIGQVVGAGNFAKVYKAFNKKSEQWVVLKVLRKESVAAMKHVDHIINERNVLKHLTTI